MQFALVLSYPFCVHFGVVLGWPALQVLAINMLALGILLPGLRDGSTLAWSAWGGLALLSAALAATDMALYVLYVPPVALPLLLLVMFGRTLRPGQVPLVTAIGVQVHGSLPPDLRRYTRRVTAFWAVFLLLLSAGSAALAAFADAALWSLFSNCINYLLVAVCFVLEYGYRRWRFRDFAQPDFREYLGIVWRADIRAGRHG